MVSFLKAEAILYKILVFDSVSCFSGRGVLGSASSWHTSWCRFCVEGEAGEAKYSNLWAVTFDFQGKAFLWLWTCLVAFQLLVVSSC